MNNSTSWQAAWTAASGNAPGDLWAFITAVTVMLALLILALIVGALFDNVIWADMPPKKALSYGLRATAVVVMFLLIFR